MERVTSPVLLCPHDCYDADLYAPDFAGALYRHALEFATDDFFGAKERTAMLKRFAADLGTIWPKRWRDHIEQLADRLLSSSEYDRTIATEFGPDWLEFFQVRWMDE